MRNFVYNFQLKKTQNILKIKSCKKNANLNNWKNRCRYAISKTYGKLSVVFLSLSYEHKKFYDFSTSKLLANFRVFDRFPTIKTTHKEPCIKFSKLFGHPKIFYRHFKKNFLKKSKISVISLTLTFDENFYDQFLNYNNKKIDLVENWFCKMLTFYLHNAPRIFTFTSETTSIV
ncbi:hypothetical protein AGLY_009727 [Aphis glycines]|uniref:Uncharacterized protein n=1 Tax=Aphis glycines TaxID=307491 RepID=A0A6G0THI4_APHGL|nr:hypothetical protein AGLY_009727 [Aphis glycines]